MFTAVIFEFKYAHTKDKDAIFAYVDATMLMLCGGSLFRLRVCV